MCSSLKILNIATSAVGLRQAAGRVLFLSRIQVSHGQAKERLHFFNGYIQPFAATFAFDCSDGNQLQLEQWPFCHIVTYSLLIIGTITLVNAKVLEP